MSYPVERHHRDQDVVGVYLNEIGRHRLLTKDDEARLGALIEAGAKARACLTSGGRGNIEIRTKGMGSSSFSYTEFRKNLTE